MSFFIFSSEVAEQHEIPTKRTHHRLSSLGVTMVFSHHKKTPLYGVLLRVRSSSITLLARNDKTRWTGLERLSQCLGLVIGWVGEYE